MVLVSFPDEAAAEEARRLLLAGVADYVLRALLARGTLGISGAFLVAHEQSFERADHVAQSGDTDGDRSPGHPVALQRC
jgi:hypothetical protein